MKIAFRTNGLLPKTMVSLHQPVSAWFRGFVSASKSQPTSNDNDHLMRCSEFGRWENGGGSVHKSARVDLTSKVEFGAVVHSESVIGANACVGSGTVIGSSVSVGNFTKIGYNAVLTNCTIGASCIIHHGVCIGQDGFGFVADEDGCIIKKPQLLQVKIGENVEIGANSCIDRGSWRDTTIGDDCKIDNLVQIGHNIAMGKGCIVCGQVGIAGSVTMGDYITLGGRVVIRDHVSIASKVRIAGNSGVTKDLTVSGDYGGFPAVPIQKWRRETAMFRKMLGKHHAEL